MPSGDCPSRRWRRLGARALERSGGYLPCRGNIARCLRQAPLWRRKLFARPPAGPHGGSSSAACGSGALAAALGRRELYVRRQLNPTELRVARRRATMHGRACAVATAARPLCRRHSLQSLACLHKPGYGAAAAWGGGTARRRPGIGLAAERLRLGAEAQGARWFCRTIAATSGAAFGRRRLGGAIVMP